MIGDNLTATLCDKHRKVLIGRRQTRARVVVEHRNLPRAQSNTRTDAPLPISLGLNDTFYAWKLEMNSCNGGGLRPKIGNRDTNEFAAFVRLKSPERVR